MEYYYGFVLRDPPFGLSDCRSVQCAPTGVVNCTAISKEDVVRDPNYGQSHGCIAN